MQAIAERLETAAVEPKGPGDVVFAELMLLYGARFGQQWAGLTPREIKASWNQRLADFSAAEISRGLEACLGLDWPPTLPEFMRLCRPAISPEAAYHEAVVGMAARARGERGEWSHPAIYWAAVRVTSHDLLSTGWQAIRSRWEAALRDVLAKGRWEPVPDPAPALPAPGQAMLSREQQRQAMEQVKSVATGADPEQAGQRRDMKAWARRIIADPKGRTAAVVDMAKRALAIEEVTAA